MPVYSRNIVNSTKPTFILVINRNIDIIKKLDIIIYITAITWNVKRNKINK